MSVINKVLRDLDQRHAAASGQGASGRAASDQIMRGTQALAAASDAAPRRLWFALISVASFLLAGLTIWWVVSYRAVPMLGVFREQAALPAVAGVPVPITAPVATVPVQPSSANAPSAAALAVTSGPVKRLTSMASDSVKPANPMMVAAPAKPPAAATTPTPALVSPTAAVMVQTPLVNATPASVTTAVPVPTLTLAQGRTASDDLPQGVTQALAQAQAMWNEGSRASAIELLRQALGRVEAASHEGSNGAAPAPLVAVARELVRMELAEGQVSNALKLLVRLESKIGQVADLWAMRANAAQRLGQHAEATSSYQRALSLKGDEPRWMLGQAISLAAQGQTAPAADLAERARMMGGIRPEIANYLRQLGVVIRAD